VAAAAQSATSPRNLAALTDDVLFDDVWNRAELSARDRRLISVTALVVGGNAVKSGIPKGRERAGERRALDGPTGAPLRSWNRGKDPGNA
jgi:hypothetical protein